LLSGCGFGRRTKLRYGGPVSTTYWYDALSRITDINRSTSKIASYQYDGLSRRTTLTYGNNASISYDYDLGNRLRRLTNNLAGGTTLDFNYADYDKVGNRKSMKINDANAHVYSYDRLYQLTFVDYNDGNRTGYDYDLLGNRRSVINGRTTNYTSNALNQYTGVAGTTYTYDKNGNLTYDGVYHYYYDCENRLTDVNNVEDAKVASFKYDYQGRRVKKVVYGNPDVVNTYLYDGDSIIRDFNERGIIQRTYYFGPGIDEPIAMLEGSSTYYYHFDGLGSVIALSNSNAQVVEKYTYDIFGKPTIKSPSDEPQATSDVNNRYIFTGREFEPETGLYYYRARYYKPSIGRFLQTDRIGYEGGLNLYTYGDNDPIMDNDPLGLGGCTQLGFGPYCETFGLIWTPCTPWAPMASPIPIPGLTILWKRTCEKIQKCKEYYLLCTVCACPPSYSCQNVYTGVVITVILDWWQEFKWSIKNPGPIFPPKPSPPPGW
jgi:RHS repeat-associated protein